MAQAEKLDMRTTLEGVSTFRLSLMRSLYLLNFVLVGFGAWQFGGEWSKTFTQDEATSLIGRGRELGINLIDTVPAYGFGRSEEIVGKAVAEYGQRDTVIIATKVGLVWQAGTVIRNGTRARLLRELEASLRRLQTSYIDPYQSTGPIRSSPLKRPRTSWRSSTS